ncbi:MAG: Holliday junction branch migration protein RuvA [Acidimicrobiales bacterium]
MIGSLRGRLLDRGATEVLVEVNGVGYRVSVSPATAVALGDVGDEVFVHIHHHVRDDAHTLYGFAARDERICFEALIGAHGVGPALALAILAVHTPDALRRALVDDDLDALCIVPGVGKRTAARLLVELKARLAVPDVESAIAAARARTNGGQSPIDGNGRSVRGDVRDALSGLGYGPDEVRQALLDLPDDGDPAVLLKQALRRLAVPR